MRRAWIVWWACSSLVVTAHVAAQAGVIVRTPQDAEVARELRSLVELQVSERPESTPRPLAAILDDAAQWPERYVVVIDRQNASVQVLRPEDGTVFSRVLVGEVMQASPYAVALTTAELLHWLHAEPVAAASAPGALRPRPRPHRSMLSAAFTTELDLRASPGYDAALARLALGAELQFGRRARPWWFALGARVATPASVTQQLDAPRAGVARVQYSSTDGALQFSAGRSAGGAALLALLSAGMSSVSIDARDAAGHVVGNDDKLVGFFALGLALRYPIAWGIALALGADAQLALQRARYRVAGAPVLEEGPLRVASHVGLAWESAFTQ